jgi:hypothetical protein
MKQVRRHWISLAIAAIALHPACASDQDKTSGAVVVESFDALVATPASFNGKPVQLDACLFVTRHGMSLYNCNYEPGGDNTLVMFEPMSKGDDEAYQRLVTAGFSHQHRKILLARVTGKFRYSPDSKPHYVLAISAAEKFRTIVEPEL